MTAAHHLPAIKKGRDMSDMKIGFIGLGNMGAPMAANLAKEHDVRGFDTVARPEGITMADSAAAAAKDADVVITMLPNGTILRAVADLPDVYRIFTVGIGRNVNHSLLRRMAELGGGAVDLEGGRLTIGTEVTGVEPVGGRLVVGVRGRRPRRRVPVCGTELRGWVASL